MLDTDDGSDIVVFKAAVNLLNECYAKQNGSYWNKKVS